MTFGSCKINIFALFNIQAHPSPDFYLGVHWPLCRQEQGNGILDAVLGNVHGAGRTVGAIYSAPWNKKQKTNKHWCYTVYNFLPFFSGVSANIAPCFNYCIIQSILFESPFFSEIIWLSLWKVGILEFFSAFIVKLKKIYISAWIWWIPADGLVSNKTHITVDYEVYVWEPCRVFTYHLNH